MRSAIKVLLTGFVVLASSVANADYITGVMTLSGDYSVGASNSSDLTTVTDVTLSTVTTAGTATLDFGTTINFSTPDGASTVDNPFGTADLSAAFLPVNNFFTYAGWQLDLATLSVEGDTTPEFLHLSGTGVVSGNDYQSTGVTWSLSASNATAYSMTVTAVPVPAAVWLFGSGLIGLIGIARRKA